MQLDLLLDDKRVKGLKLELLECTQRAHNINTEALQVIIENSLIKCQHSVPHAATGRITVL